MTKVSLKILEIPRCIVSRNPDPKTFRTFFLPLPPSTCPTSREYRSPRAGAEGGRAMAFPAASNPSPFAPSSPSVAEEDLRTLFANTGGTVKAFKFFQ